MDEQLCERPGERPIRTGGRRNRRRGVRTLAWIDAWTGKRGRTNAIVNSQARKMVFVLTVSRALLATENKRDKSCVVNIAQHGCHITCICNVLTRVCNYALHMHVVTGSASSSSVAVVPAAVAHADVDVLPQVVHRWELFSDPCPLDYVYDEDNRRIGRIQRGRPVNSCYVRSNGQRL